MWKRVVRFVVSLLLAVVAVTLTALVVLSFRPEWQRDLADGFLERKTGMQWSLGEAYWEFPNEFRARDIFILQGSEGIEVRSIRLSIDPGRSLGTGELVVRSGTVEGMLLDLSAVPAEVFGLTNAQLQHGVPDRQETLDAVRQLTELALTRVAATGIELEINNLDMTGNVLLPGNRQLLFAETIQHAVTADPSSARLSVSSAEFR